MLYFLLGIVAGVFIPVKYNAIVKDALFAAWSWVLRGPKQ